MLLLEDAGGIDYNSAAGEEKRLSVTDAEGLELSQRSDELACDVAESNLCVAEERWEEKSLGQLAERIVGEALAKLRQMSGREREANSVGVTSEAGEE